MFRVLRLLFPCCLLLAATPATLSLAQAIEGPAPSDNVAKIDNAMSAAPRSIADDATIMDWPTGPDKAMTVLRNGTNDWTCLPDMSPTPGNDPMCIDAPWLEWLDAFGSEREPNTTRMGFGYMLQANDSPYSNSDPRATGPTPDNEWQAQDVPHLMILVPDKTMLDGISTDPDNGGPWVMFANTPYVHIMAPMPLYVPESD